MMKARSTKFTTAKSETLQKMSTIRTTYGLTKITRQSNGDIYCTVTDCQAASIVLAGTVVINPSGNTFGTMIYRKGTEAVRIPAATERRVIAAMKAAAKSLN